MRFGDKRDKAVSGYCYDFLGGLEIFWWISFGRRIFA